MKSVKLNRLEVEQTYKLLLEYSIPAIIGSLVVALYNLIDSVYIGHGPGLGDHAIGGLGIVLPLMTLLSAVGALVGTGAASRISIYLGMGDKYSAEKALGNAVLLTLLFTGGCVFLIYIFTEPILLLIGATDDTFHYAHEFLLYYLPCGILLNVCFTLCSVMRASGYPKKSMYIMLLGVVANVLIAPLFIFILEWGMKGAAIATLLSVLVSLIPAFTHFFNKEKELSIQIDKIRLDYKIARAILFIGLAPFIMQLAASVVVFFINSQLRVYGGSTAIEAYTISNRLTLVIILIISGLTQGMQPIVGYNFGAKKIKRVISTVNQSIFAGICIGTIGLICGCFLGGPVVSIFNPSESLASEAVRALKIVTLMLPLSGLQMVISTFFQSVGLPVKATLLSLTRQFLLLIPALYILPHFFKLDGVWASIPVSDFVSSVLAGILYLWQISKFKHNTDFSINFMKT